MKKKDFIKIINEEISNFDFLSNEQYLKEQENVELLSNEDFQKQFICDSLLNRRSIKINTTHADVRGDWEEGEDANYINIDYKPDIIYQYDVNKEPIKFSLHFYSDRIAINISTEYDKGDQYTPSSTEAYYNNIDWSDIEVHLSSIDGDDIEFVAFKRAPIRIQNLFIREYAEEIIENKTIQTNIKKDDVNSIPYC